jgi:autotransporter-associated beta strand protein
MAIYGERYQIGAVPASSLRLGGDLTDQNGFGSNANSLNLPIALGPGQWNVGPGTAVTLNMTGPVFDSPGFTNLTKTGTGVLALAPQNRNTYSGATIINQGTLLLGNANALPLGTLMIVNQGGALNLYGHDTTIGGLGNYGSAGGSVLLNATLTTPGGGLGFAGSISGGGGLTKIGSEAMFLSSGGSFTYSGPTTVQQGFLVVNGSLANSPVTVNAGAFLEGTGTITSMSISGTVNPGFATFPGMLNGGNAVFNAGSQLNVHLNGTAAGSGYSRVFLTGTANLSAAPGLSVSLGFTPAVGTSFTILQALGGISGTFGGLPDGTVFAVGSTEFQIHYTSTTVVLTTVAPGPATALRITPGAASVTAGAPFSVTITAVDNAGITATGYRGTVHFSSTDAQATLPPDYTFTAGDGGVHAYNGVTLRTAGNLQVVFAQDTVNPNLLVGANATVSAAAPDHFQITAPASSTAGNPFDFTVTVQDAFNNKVTGYAGMVTFSSQDPFGAALPPDYTFTTGAGGDNGVHTFPGGATLFTAGTRDVTATVTSSGLGGSANVVVTPSAAVRFIVTAPAQATSGVPFDLTVTAVDAFGNTDTNYQGTVTFTNSDTDPGVVLPADYTFQPGDMGSVTFPGGVTLITSGDQTVTVNDTISGITGFAKVTL